MQSIDSPARRLLCAALLLLILGASILTSPASAGTFTKVGDTYDQCTWLFEGEIRSGDNAKLERIPAFANSDDAGATLCFDSPGGSLLEGQKMFWTLLYDKSMQTRVRKGDTCLSACAIAWLGGSITEGTAQFTFKARSIETGARLGFHAPDLALAPRSDYTSGEVKSAFALALQASHGLFQIYQSGSDGFDPLNAYLYEAILSTPPERFFEIDTAARAALAGVDVSGLTRTVSLNSNDAARDACLLAYRTHRSSGLISERDLNEELQWGREDIALVKTEGERPVVSQGGLKVVRRLDQRYWSETLCVISLEAAEWPENLDVLRVSFSQQSVHAGSKAMIDGAVKAHNEDDHVVILPVTALLPLNTPLSDH